MPFNYEAWYTEFKPMLSLTKRWEGYDFLARRLARKQICHIVETGCIRSKNDWEGAGQSTMVWNWMVESSEATVNCYSIDNNPVNVALAQNLCRSVHFRIGDSILALCSLDPEHVKAIDLLFLDSYDHNPPYGPSELHAAGELAAVWDSLKPGCLIAVDDCNGDGTGKHFLIRQFFDRIKIKPQLTGYMHVWEKT